MATAEPCDLCGTTGGASVSHGRDPKPARYLGENYGVEGFICHQCREELIDEYIDDQTRAIDIAGRVALIRRAKFKKARGNNLAWPEMTAAELDEVLPLEANPNRDGLHSFGKVSPGVKRCAC